MKVKDLIAVLQELESDLEVMLPYYETGISPHITYEVKEVSAEPNYGPFVGPYSEIVMEGDITIIALVLDTETESKSPSRKSFAPINTKRK